MKAVCNEEHVKFLGDQTMAYDTTSLISNATNTFPKVMKISNSQLSNHTTLISFDSILTVLKHLGNQNILQIHDRTALVYPVNLTLTMSNCKKWLVIQLNDIFIGKFCDKTQRSQGL